ncbi:MAG: hypothetical protein RIC12_00615 [Pirellulales bacterium]
MRSSIKNLSCLMAIAGTVAIGSARADQPLAKAPNTPRIGTSAEASGSPQKVELPACLKKLKLSSEQQEQVKAIVADYDTDLNSVWNEFSSQYMTAIRTEAMLLSAIEDNFTEPQRTHVRDQRRRVAQHEENRVDTNDKSTQSTAEPVSAVEQELEVVGVSLTPDQETAADKVQENYLSRLRSLNRDIQGLHTRLVSLEADKFVEIEKVLTEDQLKQLCEIRKSAPVATAVEPNQRK